MSKRKVKKAPPRNPARNAELDFTVTREQRDEVIFDEASHFTTFRMRGGRHPRDTRKFDDFPSAVKDARKGQRVLIYAITASGRSATIDEAEWDQYLVRWNANQKGGSHG